MTTSDSGDTPPPDGSSADGPYGPPAPQNPYGQTPPPYDPPQPPPVADATGPVAPPYGAPQPPGYGYGAPQQPVYGTPAQANHPSATTALVLGLVALAGVFVCGGLTLVLSPFAWQIGARAVREIDAQPGAYGGRDQANAGKIMGIIGTVLLALGVIVILGLLALVVVGSSTSSS